MPLSINDCQTMLRRYSERVVDLLRFSTTSCSLLVAFTLTVGPFRASAQSPLPAPNSAVADFPDLQRYRESNIALKESGVTVRVVFLGDSIIDYWGSRSGKWFEYSGWINRGIGGQTTAQLLLRIQDDVLALQPRAVVLEGGSNDMRLGFTPQEIRNRVLTMGELVRAHGIDVFVASMTPTCDCFQPVSGLRTVERIRELNQLLAEMCTANHWTLIDLNSPLSDNESHMKRELTVEGVHPNDQGYALLAKVVERSLQKYR